MEDEVEGEEDLRQMGRFSHATAGLAVMHVQSPSQIRARIEQDPPSKVGIAAVVTLDGNHPTSSTAQGSIHGWLQEEARSGAGRRKTASCNSLIFARLAVSCFRGAHFWLVLKGNQKGKPPFLGSPSYPPLFGVPGEPNSETWSARSSSSAPAKHCSCCGAERRAGFEQGPAFAQNARTQRRLAQDVVASVISGNASRLAPDTFAPRALHLSSCLPAYHRSQLITSTSAPGEHGISPYHIIRTPVQVHLDSLPSSTAQHCISACRSSAPALHSVSAYQR